MNAEQKAGSARQDNTRRAGRPPRTVLLAICLECGFTERLRFARQKLFSCAYCAAEATRIARRRYSIVPVSKS